MFAKQTIFGRIQRHHPSIMVLVFMILGIGMRLHYITREIRFDEAWTFLAFARLPLHESLTSYPTFNHHILHTILLHITWKIVGGNAVWMIRLPAFLAGVIVIPVTYLVARYTYNHTTAIMATALTTASGFMLDYSVMGRGYTLLTVIFLTLFAIARYQKRHNDPRLWVAFGVLAALGFYTAPVMLYGVGAVATWLLVSIVIETQGIQREKLQRNLFLGLLLGAVLTLLLYSPIAIVSGVDELIGNKPFAAPNATSWATRLDDTRQTLFDIFHRGYPLPLAHLILGAAILASLRTKQLTGDRVPFAAAVIGFSVGWIILHYVIPPTRIWVYLIPPYLILASAGVVSFARQMFSNWHLPFPLYYTALVVGCLLLFWNIDRQNLVVNSRHSGTYIQSEQLAEELLTYVYPDETAEVLVRVPVYWQVRYYLHAQGYPYDWIRGTIGIENDYLIQRQGLPTYIWGQDALELFQFDIPEGRFVAMQEVEGFPLETLRSIDLTTQASTNFNTNASLLELIPNQSRLYTPPNGNGVLRILSEEWITVPINENYQLPSGWQNIEWSGEFNIRTISPTDYEAFFNIRYSGDAPYYSSFIDLEGYAGIRELRDGEWSGSPQFSRIDLQPQTWYSFRLVALDDQIKWFVNGRRVAVWQNAEPIDGTISVSVPPDVEIWFNNMTLKLLEAP